MAGVATHNISYTYTSPSGCISPVYDTTITVNPLPVVAIQTDTVFNLNGSAEDISGNYAYQGDFSGLGVSPKNDSVFIFSPATAGLQTNGTKVSYTYTDGNGCTKTTSRLFKVLVPNGIIDNSLNASYCQYSPDDTILVTSSPFDSLEFK